MGGSGFCVWSGSDQKVGVRPKKDYVGVRVSFDLVTDVDSE